MQRTTLQWTSQGVDGSYVDVDSATGDLLIANIVTGNSSVLVKASDVAEAAQDPYDYSIQPSGEHVLYTANYKKQYRHSFFADYYIFDIAAKTTVPLAADQAGGKISLLLLIDKCPLIRVRHSICWVVSCWKYHCIRTWKQPVYLAKWHDYSNHQRWKPGSFQRCSGLGL